MTPYKKIRKCWNKIKKTPQHRELYLYAPIKGTPAQIKKWIKKTKGKMNIRV